MNKKANTAVFILAATVFNLLIMIVLLIASFAVAASLFGDTTNQLAGLIGFLIVGVPIVATFFLYGVVMKWLQRRYNIDQYLHPIFGRRRK